MRFFASIFDIGVESRLPAEPGCQDRYRLQEVKHLDSYVELEVPNGFVVAYEAGVDFSKFFSAGCGMLKRNDFVIFNETDSEVEVFLVELKSNCDDFKQAKRQLLSGVSMMAFCKRARVDVGTGLAGEKPIKYFGIVLTQTAVARSGTDPYVLERRRKIRDYLKDRRGIYCVNGHETNLFELRKHAAPILLDWTEANSFSSFPDVELKTLFPKARV